MTLPLAALWSRHVPAPVVADQAAFVTVTLDAVVQAVPQAMGTLE